MTLPEFFGAVNIDDQGGVDAAFRRLVGLIIDFYARHLFNPHWGEQIALSARQRAAHRDGVPGPDPRPGGGGVAAVLRRGRAGAPQDFEHRVAADDRRDVRRAISGTPTFLKRTARLRARRRPARRAAKATCSGRAIWGRRARSCTATVDLAPRLAAADDRAATRSADALFAASRHWGVSLHVNKGLAGAPAEAIAAARDTATNPAVLDAFALAISARRGSRRRIPASPATSPTSPAARRQARGDRQGDGRTAQAGADRRLVRVGERLLRGGLAQAFWGANYARLLGGEGQVRSRRGCSSCITAWAASAGAPTVSRGWPEHRDGPAIDGVPSRHFSPPAAPESRYDPRHAHPPAFRNDDQPDRRRRGHRASGERGQGTGRERARRRRRAASRSSPSGGGLALIRVSDDGSGIPAGELELAVARHCTSKLGDDIHDIRSLGFRGEALPSIGSVSRLSIRSRTSSADSAAEIRVEAGGVSPVRPAAANRGTVGRGARPVLRDAGAAQIHEGRARRKLGDHRHRQAHRHRLSRPCASRWPAATASRWTICRPATARTAS